ncbi:MAG: winged helix-turn-helix transcriptional regulator [Chloroflexi bacterium]|jgi:DNA-binding transcriptional ArsR family regulator|nr:winged helix-turn-helix transcriptional regulator [Chloroflexota bacterium]OJW05698.1 MAG: transcriptional regulator [Chloroflexi bacterium 54-19]
MSVAASRSTTDLCEIYQPLSQEAKLDLRGRLIEVAGLSEIFKVLSDETRTELLYLLSLKEMCVCDLADVMEMSMPAISHHLRLLKALRLVKYRKAGKQVYYSLADDHIVGLINRAQEHFEEER